MVKIDFIKYPEIGYLEDEKELTGREIYVFEKLDGSNSQIRKADWRVFPGRRSGYIDGKIWENLYGLKSWMGDFKKWALGNDTLYNLPENIVLFGEWLHKKLGVLDGLPVDYPESAYNKFYFIDMAQVNNMGRVEGMIPYDEGTKLIKEMGLTGIEILPFKKIRDPSRKELEVMLAGNIIDRISLGVPEGIVIKDYRANPFFAKKVVSAPYEERSRKETNPKKKYCTVPRIRKRYLELWDTIGPDITPEKLRDSVVEDIRKEEGINSDESYILSRTTEFLKRVRG